MPNNNPAKLANLKMPDYSGSWWQMRPKVLTTLPVGKWVPVSIMDIPGNTLVKMKPSMRYEGLPQLSPLYGGWTQRTKYYFVPYRLYIPELRKNLQQDWNSVPDIQLPIMRIQSQAIYDVPANTFPSSVGEMSEYLGNINVSCAGSLLDRLNMVYGELCYGNSFNNKVGVFPDFQKMAVSSEIQRTFGYTMETNLIPLLAYIDAWLYGEFNPQDKNIPMDRDKIIYSNSVIGEGTRYSRGVSTVWLSSDKLKEFVPSFAYDGEFNPGSTSLFSKISKNVLRAGRSYGEFSPVYDAINTPMPYRLMDNYPLLTEVTTNKPLEPSFWSTLRNTSSTVGLLPVTYKGDYFTSWFSTEGVSRAVNYTVTSGQTLMQLRKTNSDMIIALLSMISGNRWVDYLQWVFDTDLELKDHPILVGFDEIDFGGIDVMNNADTSSAVSEKGDNKVLGATAHKITDYNSKVKPFSVKTKEPGLIMVCTSIVPNVYYYQGSPRFMNYRTIADLWHPQYQKMGFQQLRRGEYYNPFAMSNVTQGNMYYSQDSIPQILAKPMTDSTVNGLAVSWVPLGWEFMKRPSVLSGSMKTPQFKTWSLHREFDNSYGIYTEGDVPSDVHQDDTLWDTSDSQYFNPVLVSGVDYMRSTYVDGGAYNYMFANNSKAGSNNFVVRFEFDMSVYQPLSHTLIDKQGV